MKIFLTLLIASALCVAVQAQAKTDKERAGLLGAVQTVRTEVMEFAPKVGRGVEHGRVAVREEAYDVRGNMTKRVEYNPDGSAALTLVYSYDARGRATGYEEYAGASGAARRHVYVLGERGNRVEYRMVQPDGSAGEKCLYRYDAAGHLTEEALLDHKGVLLSRNVSGYDGVGRQVSQTRYNADGSVSANGSSSYDAAGRLVERVRHEGDVLTYRVRYAYDDKGRVVEQETVGSVVETDVPSSDARPPGIVRFIYKGKERPREAIEYAPDGSVRERVKIEYDSRGNWVRRTHLPQPAGDGRNESRRTEYRTITYF